MDEVYRDRREGGGLLASRLERWAGRSDVLVLALPRGGVPVGDEVARALGAELDVLVVRKVGMPGREELALGAVASGGIVVINEDIAAAVGISDEGVRALAAVEALEVERRSRLFRGERPGPDASGRVVILVDDGLATGATMHAAVTAIRRRRPARVIVAVPVAAADTVERLRAVVDEVVCPLTPEPFYAVGLWYEDFAQVGDDEVRRILEDAQHRAPPSEAPA